MTAVHVLKIGGILQDLGEILCAEFIPFVFGVSVSIHKRF